MVFNLLKLLKRILPMFDLCTDYIVIFYGTVPRQYDPQNDVKG